MSCLRYPALSRMDYSALTGSLFLLLLVSRWKTFSFWLAMTTTQKKRVGMSQTKGDKGEKRVQMASQEMDGKRSFMGEGMGGYV